MITVAQVARRCGKSPEAVQSALEKLETILPDLINLNKLKASDWVGADCPDAPYRCCWQYSIYLMI
jgi:hypothetical protein